MEYKFEGVFPAVLTMFNEDESLDMHTFLKNINAQQKAGVHGIIIGGSLGESSTLSHDERLDLLKATKKEVNSQIPVLINVAEGSLSSAVELCRKAENNGADGLMVLPPMMYKSTDDETVAWFDTIARSTGLPIIVYNNPVDYKIEVTANMFERLLANENIMCVKESTRNISNTTVLRSRFGDRLKILGGVDTIALEAMIMGADGWIAGLVDAFPSETVAIYNYVKQGRLDKAKEIYRWFMPMLELDIDPQLVQNIKLAATMNGIGTEHVRSPRKPLMGKRREEVISIIEKGIATRPTLS